MAQFAGKHEANALAKQGELLHDDRAPRAEPVDHAEGEVLGRARARGDPDGRHGADPAGVDLLGVLDQLGGGARARAVSTRRWELDELGEPITSTSGVRRASALTAAWRLVVA